MTKTELKLLKSFPMSYINDKGEFIPAEGGVTGFSLSDCMCSGDICCKVLECFSKVTFNAEVYKLEHRNVMLQNFMLKGVNEFLGTDFAKEDMERIYTKLGNGCNRSLCEKFVLSGYDMEVLK